MKKKLCCSVLFFTLISLPLCMLAEEENNDEYEDERPLFRLGDFAYNIGTEIAGFGNAYWSLFDWSDEEDEEEKEKEYQKYKEHEEERIENEMRSKKVGTE